MDLRFLLVTCCIATVFEFSVCALGNRSVTFNVSLRGIELLDVELGETCLTDASWRQVSMLSKTKDMSSAMDKYSACAMLSSPSLAASCNQYRHITTRNSPLGPPFLIQLQSSPSGTSRRSGHSDVTGIRHEGWIAAHHSRT